MRVLYLVPMLLAAAHCTQEQPSPAAGSPAEAPRTIRLHVGESRPAGDLASVAFEAVVSDSRCPVDVTCVWQGEAVVRVQLESAGDVDTFDLSVVRRDHAEARLGDLQVRVERLLPEPHSEHRIASDEYVLVLSVIRPRAVRRRRSMRRTNVIRGHCDARSPGRAAASRDHGGWA